MKIAVTNERHGFDIIEVPDPTPGPEELIIRVAACGVCGWATNSAARWSLSGPESQTIQWEATSLCCR